MSHNKAPLKADSNKTPMVVGGISFFIILSLVVVVAVILYKRKKAYGGFYILTMPPLTDYIKKLDPHTPITKQTNKLPYDAEWEFPRNRLNFGKCALSLLCASIWHECTRTFRK